MTDIGKDDLVETTRESVTGLFSRGAIYRVAGLGPERRCKVCPGCCGLLICEVPTPKDGQYWASCCFRPVHRPGKSTLIRDLLAKTKEGVQA